MMDARQPPAKPPPPERLSAALAVPAPTTPPANGSAPVPDGTPPALEGVRIPTNNPTVRRHVYECYWRDELAAREQGIRLLSVRVLPLVVGLLDTVQRRRKLAKARDA